MGNNAPKEVKVFGYMQPLILTPTNKTPLDKINIDEVISGFEKEEEGDENKYNRCNKYQNYLKKINFVFQRTKQCDSSLNIITNFIPNIKYLAQKILSIQKEQNREIYNCLSCILGAFMGDALGDDCEFTEYNVENYKNILSPKGPWPPGEVTDDSEMSLCLAYAIMDMPDIKTLDEKYIFFLLWYMD